MYRLDRFTSVQLLVSMASNAPLLAVVAAYSLHARTGRTTTALLTAQIGQLTVLVTSLPLAFYLRGLLQDDAGSLQLSDRQGSELLLTSAQTLFMVVVVARMSISERGATAMLGLFALQASLVFAQSGGQSTTPQDLM